MAIYVFSITWDIRWEQLQTTEVYSLFQIYTEQFNVYLKKNPVFRFLHPK